MAKLLNVSINLSKIDKSKIIDGAKGKYLNVTVSVNDEVDSYGNNVSAWQSQEKEERDANQPKNYLGNGRVFWSNDVQTQSASAAQQSSEANQAAQDLDFLN